MTFKPEMEVVRFRSEDVIAASGGLTNGSKMTFSNFANDDITDNKITFDYRSPVEFTSNTTAAEVLSAIGGDKNTKIYSAKSGTYAELPSVIGNIIKNNDHSEGTWDYTFEYDSAHNRFTRVS
jgi:hypothetical protein